MQAFMDPLAALSASTALESLVVTGDQPLPSTAAQQLSTLTRLQSLEVIAGITSEGAVPLIEALYPLTHQALGWGPWGLEGFAGGGAGLLAFRGLGWIQEAPVEMAVAVGQLPCLTKLVVTEVPGQHLNWVRQLAGEWMGYRASKVSRLGQIY
jgi:hypothetical protein